MRVLFLLHAHPDLQAGGTEIFARDLFRALHAFDVTGLFLAGTANHQRPPSPGTPFQAVGDMPDEVLMWSGGFDPFFLSQIDLHGVSRSLAELLVQQQPDVIHVHHLLTIGVETVGLIRRILPHARIVMTLHDYYPICANDGQMVTTAGALCSSASPDACKRCFPERSLTDFKLRELHIAGALAMVDRFVAPSKFLRDRFVGWGLPAERITTIANGLPSTHPTPHRQTARRDHFVFFGHVNRFKGSNVALEASSMLSRQGVAHSLTLYGGTAHQTETTLATFAAACEKAPQAKYRGSYQRSELPRLIGDADWVVFPSKWRENAPLVISEALQHWRPVICSDIGGAAELVHDGVNGLTFPVGDAGSLAYSMRRAIEEPGLWQRLVDGITPPPNIGQVAAQHAELYSELLAIAAEPIAA